MLVMHALVIDDEALVRSFVATILRDDGWQVGEAESAESAFERMNDEQWSLVCCDVMLGGADGFQVLRRFKEELPDTQVVLMTGNASALGALDATSFGAYDYLMKPFGVDELQSLSSALRERLVSRSRHRFVHKNTTSPTFSSDLNLVGRSEAFIEVMKLVGRVAATNLPVLLTGESGTGKEVVASALHRRSQRESKPFIAVNCGAIPSELIESELFGHARGSFTGADRDRAGLFEEANGGTIFLDEITETTPAFQVKLLRALQKGEIRRVGSNRMQKVDVRVIAASNRDVGKEVEEGRFRQDLFYRLDAVNVYLPPFRERREGNLPVGDSVARRVWSINKPVGFTRESLRLLGKYEWPGNVRGLENAVGRAVALCSETVRPEDLPEHIRRLRDESQVEEQSAAIEALPKEEEWPSLDLIEGRYVARVLIHTGGNKQAASRVLCVDRKTLERMIKRHNISNVRALSHSPRAA